MNTTTSEFKIPKAQRNPRARDVGRTFGVWINPMRSPEERQMYKFFCDLVEEGKDGSKISGISPLQWHCLRAMYLYFKMIEDGDTRVEDILDDYRKQEIETLRDKIIPMFEDMLEKYLVSGNIYIQDHELPTRPNPTVSAQDTDQDGAVYAHSQAMLRQFKADATLQQNITHDEDW